MHSVPYRVTPLDDDPQAAPAGERQRTMFRTQWADGSQRLEIPHISGMAPGRDWEWLWEDRIPLGQVTLIAGDAGAGKSFVALDLAARTSRGKPRPATLRNPFRVRWFLAIVPRVARLRRATLGCAAQRFQRKKQRPARLSSLTRAQMRPSQHCRHLSANGRDHTSSLRFHAVVAAWKG